MAGGLGYLSYCLLYAALSVSLDYLAAHVLAFAVNVLVTFWLHCRITYGVPPTTVGLARFALSSLLMLATSGGLALGGVDLLGTPPSITPVLAVIAAMPLSYFVHRWAVSLPPRVGVPPPSRSRPTDSPT